MTAIPRGFFLLLLAFFASLLVAGYLAGIFVFPKGVAVLLGSFVSYFVAMVIRTKLRNSEAESPRPRLAHDLYRPPGGFFLVLSSTLFSKTTFESVFQPAIEDFREEYYEALADGEGFWKRFFIYVRGYWGLWRTFDEQIPFSITKVFQILFRWATPGAGSTDGASDV